MWCSDDDDDDDDQIRVVPSNPAFSERHTGHAPSYKYLYSHASGSGCGFLASSESSSFSSTLFSIAVDRRRVQRGGLNVFFKVRRCRLETTTTFEMAASVFWHRLVKKVILLSPKDDDASKRSDDTQRDATTRRRRSRAY